MDAVVCVVRKNRVSEVVPQPGLAWRKPTVCRGPAEGSRGPEIWGWCIFPRTSKALSRSGGKKGRKRDRRRPEVTVPLDLVK